MLQVVLGALVRDGRVLLGHRSAAKLAHPDVWDLPGGVVEAGETELSALTRELQEELGITVAAASVSRLCRSTVGTADQPVSLSAWLVTDWQGDPVNAAPEEHDDLGWFGVDELPPLAHAFVRSAVADAMRSLRA